MRSWDFINQEEYNIFGGEKEQQSEGDLDPKLM